MFAADGTRVGTELLVNTATASSQDSPQITALANGGFVVTWQTTANGVGGATGDISGDAVKAQVFAAGRDPRRLGAPGQHRDCGQSGCSADHGAAEWRLRGDVGRQQPGRGRSDGGHQQQGREGAGVQRHLGCPQRLQRRRQVGHSLAEHRRHAGDLADGRHRTRVGCKRRVSNVGSNPGGGRRCGR